VFGVKTAVDPGRDNPHNQIRVCSLNAATGLESPIVFLLGIYDLYEMEQSIHLSEEERADLIRDNTRKLYMAYTRAGQRLIITYVGPLPAIFEPTRRSHFMIRYDEPWVQIALLNEQNQIYFTDEFLEIMDELGWEAKAFTGYMLGLWYDPFEHMLDYTSGEARLTADQPGTFDRNNLDEPQDVVEYWAETWSQHDSFHKPAHEAGTGLNLGVEWYRGLLRAKLVSIRLPRRLLVAYKEQVLSHITPTNFQ
jgi:hypothetical protein